MTGICSYLLHSGVGRCFRMEGLHFIRVGEDASTDVRHYLGSSFAGDGWFLLVATQGLALTK